MDKNLEPAARAITSARSTAIQKADDLIHSRESAFRKVEKAKKDLADAEFEHLQIQEKIYGYNAEATALADAFKKLTGEYITSSHTFY